MTININLLPWREELKEQLKREFLSLLGLGFVVAAGLILIIHMLISRQISFQNESNAYLKNEITMLEKQIAEIQALENEKKQLLARMAIIQQLQMSRPQVVRLFDGIAHIVPSGMYLTNLTRTGTHILIDGKAESNTRVSTFMRNIEASNWLRSPVLSLIQADEKEAKSATRIVDRLIGFNLQADEVMDSHSSLQKEVKTDKEPTTAIKTHTSESPKK